MLVLRTAVAVVCLPLLSLAQEGSAAPDQTPSDFVRYVKVDDGGHLDTAITTYRKGDVELTLFGAVHIGDAAYFAALNDRFPACEVLLYELVGPADFRPTKDREGSGFVSLLQNALKTSLELSFQLDEIDYQAANFVHADMTPSEFARSMEERGESMLSIMLQMMQAGAKQQREKAEAAADEGAEPAPAFDLVKAFQSGEGRHLLRTTFAAQLEEVEMLMAGGKGSTLLEGRNEKCLEVLQREIAAGRKKIGIYYGAAHFPHMERRLVEDLGFVKTGHEWLQAWDCKKRPDVKYDRALVKLRQRARDELTALAAAARPYRAARGGSPPTVPELHAARKANGDEPWYTGPVDDPWGKPYTLRKRPTGGRWEAVSAGQDGELGTADDLVVIEPRAGGLFGR